MAEGWILAAYGAKQAETVVHGRRPQGQKMHHFHATKLSYLTRQVKGIPDAV